MRLVGKWHAMIKLDFMDRFLRSWIGKASLFILFSAFCSFDGLVGLCSDERDRICELKPDRPNSFVFASEAKQSRLFNIGTDCRVAALLAKTDMKVET